MAATSASRNSQPRSQAKLPTSRRRVRMSPKDREAFLIEGAVMFFAERGFSAQTRELAAQLDVSESLIYRYFGNKETLIQRVYEETILSRWDPSWLTGLSDRSASIRTRLIRFYRQYLEVIDNRCWIRIAMHSSLDGLDLTNNYIVAHVETLLSTIAFELQASVPVKSRLDFETMWHFHSGFIYYLVRKHIHMTPVPENDERMVELMVDTFLQGIGVDF